MDAWLWDEPLVRLPDTAALALFLRGRGLVCWARRPGPATG
ncbi:MAG: hypothetical protein ACJ73S_13990 [Mycobacteriales bacterium]